MVLLVHHSQLSLEEKIGYLNRRILRSNRDHALAEANWSKMVQEVKGTLQVPEKDVDAVAGILHDTIMRVARERGITSIKKVIILPDSYEGSYEGWTITLGRVRIAHNLHLNAIDNLAKTAFHEIAHGVVALKYGYESVMGFIDDHGPEFQVAMDEMTAAYLDETTASISACLTGGARTNC